MRTMLAFAATGGLVVAGHFLMPSVPELGFVSWAILLYCEFALTVAALGGLGGLPAPPSLRRFWPMAGFCLASQFGIMAGFGILIVPGFVLSARWLIGGPILLGDGTDILTAFGESWTRTEGDTWPLLGVILILYAPFFAVGAIAEILKARGTPVLALNEIADLLAYAGLIVSWFAAVAAYELRGPSIRGSGRD